MQKLLLLIFYFFIYISNSTAEYNEIKPCPKVCSEGFSSIVEPLMPAVVNIYTAHYRKAINIPELHRAPSDPFAKFFEQFDLPFGFEELYQDPKAISLGSGFIIDPTGYIVTNYHVIAGADEINVKLDDNTELPAKLIGSDQKTDIALLKIETKKHLPSVKFGDSTNAKVGDWIIAIGNPFGLGGTVTTGIISSKGRDINDNGIVDNFIQTDAAINMGNSGGPMFNLNGEVIGVNTAIFSSSGNNIGIGFAIPSLTVESIIAQLKSHGKISRGFLNIKIQEITSQIAEAMNIATNEGVLVVDVDPNGVGNKAGLKAGDIIIQINDIKIKNTRKLQVMIAETPVNSNIKITILRNGIKKDLSCKLIEASIEGPSVNGKERKKANISSEDNFDVNGITFSNITEDTFDNGEKISGVYVQKIKQNPEWKGLKRGDIVLSINQNPISSIKDFEEIYNKAIKAGKKHIVLFIKRHGSKLFVALPL